MRISVLDQVPIRSGGTPRDSIRETIELARLVDGLGYHRYWLAEHHSSHALSCASPEVLIPVLAGATSRIRVGAGGIMLPHYSALKVAESFRMLEALFPGRIDLGLGRAPGSDALTDAALADVAGLLRTGQYSPHAAVEQYPAQVRDLIGFLSDSLPQQHPFRSIRAMPQVAGSPEIWLLGSGTSSARLAAYLGCSYSHAHFIAPQTTAEAVATYRAEFRPGVVAEPTVSLGVMVVCAESEEIAERLCSSRFLWWIKLTKGDFGPFPSVEEAELYPYTEADRRTLERLRQRSIYGEPAAVSRQLAALRDEVGVQELVVLTITHDATARRRSYELLARELGLEGSSSAASEEWSERGASLASSEVGEDGGVEPPRGAEQGERDGPRG